MKIYLFDGKKIISSDPKTQIGKKFFVKNIFHIETSHPLGVCSGSVPEIIEFKIGKRSTFDSLELLYKYSGWHVVGGDPDIDYDFDDYSEYTTIISKMLNRHYASKLLFCYKEKDVYNCNIHHIIDAHLEPNRALLEVDLLGVSMPLHYITTDLSLKKGDKVIVTGGKFTQTRGTVKDVIKTYYEYFGEKNLYLPYELYYVEHEPNDAMFALEEDLKRNPIKEKYRPSNFHTQKDTGNYLSISFNAGKETQNCIIVCTESKRKVKETVLRLTKAYKTQNEEYNDIRRYCDFHCSGFSISSFSLSQFVIYVITKYYNMGWQKKEFSFDTMEIEC